MSFDVEEVALRSGTTSDWASGSAPVLGEGELGINLTTGEVKVGDGSTAFASLRSVNNLRRGSTTLVAGAKVVSNTSVTANSIIILTAQSLGTVTAAKALAVTARTPGTSFTITSADNTDTSVVGYVILEP